MSQSDMHLLFQQMGEVLTGVRVLHDMNDLRQAQAEQLHELVRADLATLRQDQRDLEEKFECIVSIVQYELEAIRSGTNEHARALSSMVGVVEDLRKPVADILGLKSRVAGLVFGAGLVGSAALWLAEPIYSWIVNASFNRR